MKPQLRLRVNSLFVMMTALLLCQAVEAQSLQRFSTRANVKSKSSYSLRPVVGITAMTIATNTHSSATDAGLSAGGLIEFGSGFGTFETGLLYSQLGGAYYDEQSERRVRLEYLSIPLLGKMNLSGVSSRGLFMKAGLLPSFNTSASSSISRSSESESRTIKLSSISSFDTLAMLAVGGAIPMSRTNSLTLEFAFMRGLIGVIDDSSIKVYNQGYLISMGYSFGL